MTPCDQKDCESEGIWTPIIVLRPPFEFGNHELPMVLGMKFCLEHKNATKLEDLFNTTNQEPILEITRAMGLMDPDLSRTTLRWGDRHDPHVMMLDKARKARDAHTN